MFVRPYGSRWSREFVIRTGRKGSVLDLGDNIQRERPGYLYWLICQDFYWRGSATYQAVIWSVGGFILTVFLCSIH